MTAPVSLRTAKLTSILTSRTTFKGKFITIQVDILARRWRIILTVFFNKTQTFLNNTINRSSSVAKVVRVLYMCVSTLVEEGEVSYTVSEPKWVFF